jgi:hypothetical protein
LDIKFTVVFKGTTNKKMENFLAPIEVEILCFFSLKKQRLQRKAGKWFTDKARTIRFK